MMPTGFFSETYLFTFSIFLACFFVSFFFFFQVLLASREALVHLRAVFSCSRSCEQSPFYKNQSALRNKGKMHLLSRNKARLDTALQQHNVHLMKRGHPHMGINTQMPVIVKRKKWELSVRVLSGFLWASVSSWCALKMLNLFTDWKERRLPLWWVTLYSVDV